eukprot:1273374-Pleurochrysis_carterae.AAC.1
MQHERFDKTGGQRCKRRREAFRGQPRTVRAKQRVEAKQMAALHAKPELNGVRWREVACGG